MLKHKAVINLVTRLVNDCSFYDLDFVRKLEVQQSKGFHFLVSSLKMKKISIQLIYDSFALFLLFESVGLYYEKGIRRKI